MPATRPRLNKFTWWQKIDRLPIPPQHLTLLWHFALNHAPFQPQNATNCFCGSPETIAHLAGSCPLWTTFRSIFLQKWISLAPGILNYLSTKHLIPISPEVALPRIRTPNLDPHLWVALPLLEWPHIQDFDDPVVNPFCHTWALAASTLLYNIRMARDDLAYQNNLWPTTRLVQNFNTTLKVLPLQTPKQSYPPPLNSALQPYLPDPSTGLPPLDTHHLRPP
ncbi:hypothetical protein IWQ61_007252 [Dispira simplex]|nr:hypothetical protein IWQ61_007252 [Dispira simplex]